MREIYSRSRFALVMLGLRKPKYETDYSRMRDRRTCVTESASSFHRTGAFRPTTIALGREETDNSEPLEAFREAQHLLMHPYWRRAWILQVSSPLPKWWWLLLMRSTCTRRGNQIIGMDSSLDFAEPSSMETCATCHMPTSGRQPFERKVKSRLLTRWFFIPGPIKPARLSRKSCMVLRAQSVRTSGMQSTPS